MYLFIDCSTLRNDPMHIYYKYCICNLIMFKPFCLKYNEMFKNVLINLVIVSVKMKLVCRLYSKVIMSCR